MKLTEVKGNGMFSGKGYVTVPFIGMLNVAVAFSNIKVNTDRQLMEGQIANADSVLAQVKAAMSLVNDAINKIKELLKDPVKNRQEIVQQINTFQEQYNQSVDKLPITDYDRETLKNEYKETEKFSQLAANSPPEELQSSANEASQALTKMNNELSEINKQISQIR